MAATDERGVDGGVPRRSSPPLVQASYWTEERLGDAEAKLRLLTDFHSITSQVQALALTQQAEGAGAPKRAPTGRSTYRLSREAGLQEIANRVLLTPQQYCENLEDAETQSHEVRDARHDPP
jgi:hypothetical protein